MFEYDREKGFKTLAEYKLFEDGEIYIPPHIWKEIKDQFPRDEVILHLSNLLRAMPFPLTQYSAAEVLSDWNSLKNTPQNVEMTEWTCHRLFDSIPLLYRGKPCLIQSNTKGRKVSNQFTESVRMECGSKAFPSPISYWTENKVMYWLRSLWTLLDDKEGLNGRSIQQCIALSSYVASQFNPSTAKCIYDFFGAKKVLDLSMGWGDRLVGFLASGADSYVGIDPNTKLHTPYQSICDWTENKGGLDKPKTTRFICSPAEEADLSNMKFDFVFTSPPYFNIERYSEDGTQSWKRYKQLSAWHEGFLFPSLKKAWDSLEEGGRIAINIADSLRDKHNICTPMLSYMESIGATYEGVMGYRMSKRPGNFSQYTDDIKEIGVFGEPIFIWSKGEAPEPKWNQDNFFGV